MEKRKGNKKKKKKTCPDIYKYTSLEKKKRKINIYFCPEELITDEQQTVRK